MLRPRSHQRQFRGQIGNIIGYGRTLLFRRAVHHLVPQALIPIEDGAGPQPWKENRNSWSIKIHSTRRSVMSTPDQGQTPCAAARASLARSWQIKVSRRVPNVAVHFAVRSPVAGRAVAADLLITRFGFFGNPLGGATAETKASMSALWRLMSKSFLVKNRRRQLRQPRQDSIFGGDQRVPERRAWAQPSRRCRLRRRR